MMPITFKVYVMTSGNKCVPILTKEHFNLIDAELWGTVVNFAQISKNCWIDTKAGHGLE